MQVEHRIASLEVFDPHLVISVKYECVKLIMIHSRYESSCTSITAFRKQLHLSFVTMMMVMEISVKCEMVSIMDTDHWRVKINTPYWKNLLTL